MGIIKQILKKAPLYDAVKSIRNKKITNLWTKHDQEMLNFYSQFISQGELVFDVGANIGSRTKIFLKQGCKVVAIEPQDECVDILNLYSGKNKNLTIIQKVLGSYSGEAELMISDVNTLSSLSSDWIEAVKSSGRFSNYSWERRKVISMTTLDQLIELYGIPTFVKVDVEGFEYEVLKGLSRPISHISLEFASEFISSTLKCIEHLESLGQVLFNYSLGECMDLVLEKYVSSNEIADILSQYMDDKEVWGDLYCQFIIV